MHPANQDLLAQVREQNIRQPVQQNMSPVPSPRISNVRRLRSEESWVDISSRNSTSSLSSIAGDESVVPGRGLDHTAMQRRRRLQRSYSAQTYGSNRTQTTGVMDSSQDEYEESESESEQEPVMTSSNEDIHHELPSPSVQQRGPMRRVPSSGSSDAVSVVSSNDETSTALGVPRDTNLTASFHPQPNAFTQPQRTNHAYSYQPEPTSYFSAAAPMVRAASLGATNTPVPAQTSSPATTPGPRPSLSRANTHTRTRSHTPYNMIAPNHSVSVDHDAALRASLSTLLSCAAAARGAPKRDQPSTSDQTAGQEDQVAQGTLRLVPGTQLDQVPQQPLPQHQATTSHPQRPLQAQPKSSKRKSKSKSRPSSPHRKRANTSSTYASEFESTSLSPTLLWAVGAGVFVLGGVVLFSAGYTIGKEIGYVNGLSDAGVAGCRPEAGSLGSGSGSLRGMGRRGWRSATAGASIWGVS